MICIIIALKYNIQAISNQRKKFTYKLGDEIIDELIIAEYRIRMLVLMKDVDEGIEVTENPFQRENRAKKERYEELLLEDLEEVEKQYQNIDQQRKYYIKTGIVEKKKFEKLDRLSEELQESIDLAMVDDLSISELLTNDELQLWNI